MLRIKTTASLAFIVLAALATFAGARADYPYPQPTPTFCEETPPLAAHRIERPRAASTAGRVVNRPDFSFCLSSRRNERDPLQGTSSHKNAS